MSTETKLGRPPKYPYEKWFDGEEHIIPFTGSVYSALMQYRDRHNLAAAINRYTRDDGERMIRVCAGIGAAPIRRTSKGRQAKYDYGKYFNGRPHWIEYDEKLYKSMHWKMNYDNAKGTLTRKTRKDLEWKDDKDTKGKRVWKDSWIFVHAGEHAIPKDRVPPFPDNWEQAIEDLADITADVRDFASPLNCVAFGCNPDEFPQRFIDEAAARGYGGFVEPTDDEWTFNCSLIFEDDV